MGLQWRDDRFQLSLRDDVRKYLGYAFDRRSFVPEFDEQPLTQHALEAAEAIRERGHGSTIIVHGIMPRSGTVYVGELLRRHPAVHAYPNRLWEMPFLQQTYHILRMQRDFFRTYEQNIGKIGDHDFLPLFGSAFIAYLRSFAPEGQRLLLKVPGVHHLDRFFTVFPYEHLLVLVRDGRDVVHSTRKTWPQITFGMASRRWKRSARMVLAFHERYRIRSTTGASAACPPPPGAYWLARFEDAVHDPAGFVREACRHFDLDEAAYPFDEADDLPVRGSTTLKRQGPVDWAPVKKPAGFKPIAHWRDWSWWQKWRFKHIAGQELIDLGYAEDFKW